MSACDQRPPIVFPACICYVVRFSGRCLKQAETHTTKGEGPKFGELSPIARDLVQSDARELQWSDTETHEAPGRELRMPACIPLSERPDHTLHLAERVGNHTRSR
jgi:hypothetical protein